MKIYRGNSEVLEFIVGKDCTRIFKLMDTDEVRLKFSRASVVYLQIGDYIQIAE
jgi:hypothetical protein